jgi:hypothetical protein
MQIHSRFLLYRLFWDESEEKELNAGAHNISKNRRSGYCDRGFKIELFPRPLDGILKAFYEVSGKHCEAELFHFLFSQGS